MCDTYTHILISERTKLNISSRMLCEGICSEDMYYKVENGQSSMDRISIKRLLARLGVDNGDYENYLDYDEYETWKKRKELINYIEDGDVTKANEILGSYYARGNHVKNKSRIKIEKQFEMFMHLQIMKISDKSEYERKAKELYEKALKITVPQIDDKPLDKLLLSPVELNLVLEYKSRMVEGKTLYDIIEMYEEMLKYISGKKTGKLFRVKLYSKIVIYMYRAICDHIEDIGENELKKIYENIWEHSNNGFEILQQRKSLLYLFELLEVQENVLLWLSDNDEDKIRVEHYKKIKEQVVTYIDVLKQLYVSYDVELTMTNDCYLYRESGIYCFNDVVKIRRNMMNMTQEELADEDLSVVTIRRLEAMNMNINRTKFKNLFDKLSLYPSYLNMGIVTDNKEAIELYEELRFATTRFECEKVETIIQKLRDMLPKHKINEQTLYGTESLNMWRQGKITSEQYVQNQKRALELTIELKYIRNAKKIFLTTEELTAVMSISSTYKALGEYDKAKEYIKEIVDYMREIEEQNLVDGRMGIYEMTMEYISSLYGDIGRYDESNSISYKLLKMSLKLRRNVQIHNSIYNVAWNNHECERPDIDYHAELKKCIILSKLSGDASSESFYNSKFTEW